MLEYTKCNLCGSDNFKVLYKDNLNNNAFGDIQQYACTNSYFSKHGQIVKCKDCGLVYSNPRFSSQEIYSRYQNVVDAEYIREKKYRLLTFTNSLNEIEKLKAKGKILDVGCYAGFFLDVASSGEWETYGIEPSIWACGYAKEELGLNVKTGTLEEADFCERYFDVITFWDTMEHLTDPAGTLKEAHRVLKDDGLVCISTINIDSFFAKVLGKKWPQLMQMHTYYYSFDMLNKLLIKNGFVIFRKHLHKRVIRLGYLINRFKNHFPFLSKMLYRPCKNFGLIDSAVTVSLGDLITVYAKKLCSFK